MIEETYQNALLSDAAYIDFSGISGVIPDSLKSDFMFRGFTDFQYDSFVNRYEIVNQLTKSYGFSATIFRDIQNVNKLTVSFRGTEFGDTDGDGLSDTSYEDIYQDVLIALGLSAVSGTVGFGQVGAIDNLLINSGLIDANDNVIAGYENAINFTGHSLGGHLAIVTSYKYPGLVDQTFTYNGAGIRDDQTVLFGSLDKLWIDLVQPFISGQNLETERVHNFVGDAGIELTSSDLFFNRPNGLNKVFIESDGLLDSHSVSRLVDSLGLYSIFALLDPSLNFESGPDKIYNILDAATNISDQSLETITRQLGDFLGGNLAFPLAQQDVEVFYQEVAALDKNFTIDVLAHADILNIASQNTEDGRGYRYALVNMLPFAITSNFSGTAAQESKYDIENFSEQYLQDRAYVVSRLLSRNILDSTAVLSTSNEEEFYKDILTSSSAVTSRVPVGTPDNQIKSYIFGDDDENTFDGGRKGDRLYGGAGNDTIHGGSGSDYIEGNTGNDNLHGDDNRDYLYGGKGEDSLYGGAGDDFLSGGGGDFADSYYYVSGDGNDTIIDADLGDDRIIVNGIDLSTLNFKAVMDMANIYLANGDDSDPFNDISFIDVNGEGLIGIADANGSGGSITLNSFNKAQSDFGINLGASEIDAPPALEVGFHQVGDGGITVNGSSTTLENLYANREGTSQSAFNQGSLVFNAVAATSLWTYADEYTVYFEGGDRNDELTGGDGQDVLRGMVGDDVIIGRGDDAVRGDLLEGGQGSDHIWGGDQADNLNDGADLIWGNVSSKYVHFGTGITEADVFQGILTGEIAASFEEETVDANDVIDGGLGNDLISGDNGDDRLYGGVGDDQVAGGMGADEINGGDGQDRIFGDSRHENILQIIPESHDAMYTFLDPVFSSEANTRYDDILLGGAGDDTVYGEIGNDVVLGEAGDDSLYGDRSGLVNDSGILKIQSSPAGNGETFVSLDGQFHGNDTLHGGAGNDNLFGNGGDDILYGGTENDILFGDDSTLDDAVDLAWHGKDRLFGGEGNDYLFGGGNDDYLEGGAGDDILEGDLSVAGVITSEVDGAQNAVLDMQYHGNDLIKGDAGNDLIIGGAGDDQLFGGEDNDEIYGDSTYDISSIITNPSFDEAFHGHDEIHGGDGIDSIYAGAGNDIVFGDDGQDYLWGQSGDDRLLGGEGNDQLLAGEGDDSLEGGKGNDVLQGGNGNDTYVFNAGDGVDTLQDTSGRVTLQFNAISDLDAIDIVQSGQNTAINYGSGDAVLMDNASFNHVTHFKLAGGLDVNRHQFIDQMTSNIASADSQLSIQSQSPDTNVNVNYLGVDDDLLLSVTETDVNGQTPLQKTFAISGGVAGAIIFTDVNGDLSTPEFASELIIKNWWLAPSNQRTGSVIVNEVVQPIQSYDIPRTISGGPGNDQIYGGNANDDLHGDDGNDSIYGSDGMDTLYGDRGNDTLLGGQGIDEYWFSAGDGFDVIGNSTSSGTTTLDIIQFDETVNPSDVTLRIDLVDLLIDYNGGSDQIRVNAYFAGDDFQIDTIQFADGTVWDETYIRGVTGIAESDLWFQGVGENNRYGDTPEEFNYVITNGNNGAITYLEGGVFGNLGDQVIVSGSGSRYPNVEYFNSGRLDGFLGNDTIYAGGGDDEVVGGPSTFADPNFYDFDPYGGYFYSLPYGMAFHNIKGLPVPTVDQNPDDGDNLLFGEGGDDLIRAGSGIDTIDGGHGNDHLYGSFNTDTYRFNRGYGHDTINDTFNVADQSPLDVIEFGEGIAPEDIIIQHVNVAAYYEPETATYHDAGEVVRFAIRNTRDSIAMNVTNSALSAELLEVHFANGDSWSSGDVQSRIVSDQPYADSLINANVNNEVTGTNGSERLEASVGDEILNALSGDDGLYGFEGIDQLFGGAGNDQLIGGAGNDWLEGGSGNDYLIGGNDNDTYLFSAGFGNDIIDNYDDTATATNQIGGSSIDTIQFQSGIASSDVSLSRDGDNLIVSHNSDQITVKNHFFGEDLGFNERYALDEIHFVDEQSVIWDKAVINAYVDDANTEEPSVPNENIPPFWWDRFPGRGWQNRYGRSGLAGGEPSGFFKRLAGTFGYSKTYRPFVENVLTMQNSIANDASAGNELFFASQVDKLVQAMATSGAAETSDLSIYSSFQEEVSNTIAASFQSA